MSIQASGRSAQFATSLAGARTVLNFVCSKAPTSLAPQVPTTQPSLSIPPTPCAARSHALAAAAPTTKARIA
eukprot:CAMPEP_0115428574 /NCGR_PEP_ID=MMETSP0271-20121206/30054_1 /TAXON_ID=71861 /ORGANISM="Scrippsiella trochoidea, Strain CCMP3099" /LENGTH=71 /DNA_ID=CAMNT_0002853685 /DNA_START=176 /DNA_END=387 /DNA_ORIENTATION=-